MTQNDQKSSFLGHIDVVDDDKEICRNLSELFIFAGYEVRTWSSAEDFLENLPNAIPAVVVTDIRMSGLSGVEMHELLNARARSIPVIYMSGESTIPQAVKAMKLGPVEFLQKPFSREEILEAVIRGLETDRVQMRKIIEQKRVNEAVKGLTPREQEVLQLLVRGYSNLEIVETLSIALPTAKQYKMQIMQKLGARSLSQLMELVKT